MSSHRIKNCPLNFAPPTKATCGGGHTPSNKTFLGYNWVFVPNGVSIRAANSQKWKFPTKYCPAHKGYFVGETASPSKNVPRFHTSLLTKQGIDTNSHFCRIKNFLQNFAPSTKDAAAGGTPSPCNKNVPRVHTSLRAKRRFDMSSHFRRIKNFPRISAPPPKATSSGRTPHVIKCSQGPQESVCQTAFRCEQPFSQN